jgi:hypothetical protein
MPKQNKQRRGRRASGAIQTRRRSESSPQELLSSLRPALDEAREYIEGNPMRAAAIGAVAGGFLMSLFATEKGRSFVKMAYDYANPMVTKAAREFVSQTSGGMPESTLSRH